MSRNVLGYPSQTEAIVALTVQGLSRVAIAAELGISDSTIRGTLYRRGMLATRPTVRDKPVRTAMDIPLNYDVARQMRPAAARRDTTVRQLAQAIIEAVVDRGLVDMVLSGREV